MQSVRLHVDGKGEIWALSQCRACGEVDKHRLRDAVAGAIPCRKCRHSMNIAGATIAAMDNKASPDPGPLQIAVQSALEADGLAGAARELNQRVPHRYTGIFLKDGPSLRNVALFDKQTPSPVLWPPFPMGNSFCSMIIGSGDPLAIASADADAREGVRNHPAARIVQAYCGVPLINPEGEVLGTLCHFDEQATAREMDLVELLTIPILLLPYLAAARKAR